MDALLLYFVLGSIVAVPFLGFHLLRTRRELNALRTELRARGLIGSASSVGPESATSRGANGTPAVASGPVPHPAIGAIDAPRDSFAGEPRLLPAPRRSPEK